MLQGTRGAAVFPILTYPSDFRILPSMKKLLQVGLNGRVPVPPEKRFLIQWKERTMMTNIRMKVDFTERHMKRILTTLLLLRVMISDSCG